MVVHNSLIRILSFTLALSLLAPAAAQIRESASLRVVVLDPNGAAIVAATVRLTAKNVVGKTLTTNANGEAVFSQLSPATYRLIIEAQGFVAKEVSAYQLKSASQRLEVRLEVAGANEVAVVTQDEREKATDPRGNAFTNVLTPEQIAQLPDDPEEMEAALKQMAGPGSTIRVNGFTGGKLPPKSQIREIRFRMNPYAAENHEATFIGIDITTKPGIDSWHSSVNFGFRDESLNARNAFAPVKAPEQTRRYAFTLDGPLWRNRTSMFLAADGADNYDSSTIVAALPEGNFNDVFRRPARKLNLSARLEHATTKTHTSHFEYQRNAFRQDNLGAGNFNLLERAYTSDQAEHLVRVADSGLLTKRLINELRFQTRWETLDSTPASADSAIIVLNAFSRGGAQIEGVRQTRDFEIADNLDFSVGKSHAMRAGILFEGGNYRSTDNRNAGGTFTFASLEDFQRNRPTTFSRRLGDPAVEFDQYQFAWYWQDDHRLAKSLTFSYGLRHELQSHLDDHNNLAPRFGLAWSPFKDGKTTIRAGGGVFYDWFAAGTFEQTLRVDGVRQRDLVIQNPGFPDPLSGGLPITLPPSRIQAAPDLRMPYVHRVSFGATRNLGTGLSLMANYFYQRGAHLLRGHDINAPTAAGIRPDPTAGNVVQIESTANSKTHGLIISANFNQAKRRLFGAFNYFLSKTTDEADSPLSLPADNFNLRGERSVALTDARHRLFGMLNMDVFKGIRVGALVNYSSATPYNITTGFDDNRDSVSNDRPAGIGRNSARGAAQFNMNLRLSWGFGFGKPAEQPMSGGVRVVVARSGDNDTLGSMPSMSNQNKRYKFEFYAQAFNLLNNTNPVNFTGVQTSPFFGRATAALPGRRLESGIRFSF